MSLTLVSTPIGDPGDITLRAIEILKAADVVIGEERKELSRLLKRLGIEGKAIELLNEHSENKDLLPLVELCREQQVALVADCGTPGFCDPGADLVAACRSESIAITSAPGASSLMDFITLCGVRLDRFYFGGFLPANREERQKRLQELAGWDVPIVLMDTPYRLQKLLGDLNTHFKSNKIKLGLSLTQADENFLEGRPSEVLDIIEKKDLPRKAEFVLMILPSATTRSKPAGAKVKRPRTGEKRGKKWSKKRTFGRS